MPGQAPNRSFCALHAFVHLVGDVSAWELRRHKIPEGREGSIWAAGARSAEGSDQASASKISRATRLPERMAPSM